MQPGVYRGIPNSEYHHGPGDSKSGLDLVRRSPITLRAVRTGEVSREATPSQALGTAFHTLVLEPQEFAARYAKPFLPPSGALATIDDMKAALTAAEVPFKASAKKGEFEDLVRQNLPGAVLLSDARAAYDVENRDKEVISLDDWSRIHRMRDAVMAHPAARKLLAAPGEAELSAYWMEPVTDPATGEQLVNDDGQPMELLMRCRPDFWRHDGILVDLKSTSPGGASPEEFARSIEKWRYHVQHPLYLNGSTRALAIEAAKIEDNAFAEFCPPRAFVFVAVETDACVVDGVAKGVAVYQLQPDSVALGATEYREDVHALATCYRTGQWPGYDQRIQPIELPAYAFTRAAARAPAAA